MQSEVLLEINKRFNNHYLKWGDTVDIFLFSLAGSCDVEEDDGDGLQIYNEQTGSFELFGKKKNVVLRDDSLKMEPGMKLELVLMPFVVAGDNRIITYDEFIDKYDLKEILMPTHLNFEKTITIYNFSLAFIFNSNNIKVIEKALSIIPDELHFDYLYYFMISEDKPTSIRWFAIKGMIKLIDGRNKKNRCLYYILELELQQNTQIAKEFIDLFANVLDEDMTIKIDRIRGTYPITCRESFDTCPQCKREVCFDVIRRNNIGESFISCENCWTNQCKMRTVKCWSCNKDTHYGWCELCGFRNDPPLQEITNETGSFYCERHSEFHYNLPMKAVKFNGVVIHHKMIFPTNECTTSAPNQKI